MARITKYQLIFVKIATLGVSCAQGVQLYVRSVWNRVRTNLTCSQEIAAALHSALYSITKIPQPIDVSHVIHSVSNAPLLPPTAPSANNQAHSNLISLSTPAPAIIHPVRMALMPTTPPTSANSAMHNASHVNSHQLNASSITPHTSTTTV